MERSCYLFNTHISQRVLIAASALGTAAKTAKTDDGQPHPSLEITAGNTAHLVTYLQTDFLTSGGLA